MLRFLPVYEPDLSGNEKRYVAECLDTNWISQLASSSNALKPLFRDVTGALHAITVSNGTVALHRRLVSLLLPRGIDRNAVMTRMSGLGVDSRPFFYSAHEMPVHERMEEHHPISEDIAARGISLPSFPAMTDEMVLRVTDALSSALGAETPRSVAHSGSTMDFYRSDPRHLNAI